MHTTGERGGERKAMPKDLLDNSLSVAILDLRRHRNDICLNIGRTEGVAWGAGKSIARVTSSAWGWARDRPVSAD